MNLRALLLDAAGTLIDFREPPPVIYARVAAAHGIVAAPDEIAARLAEGIRKAAGLPFARVPRSEIATLEREYWRGIVRTSLGDVAADGPCFDDLFDAFGRRQSWRVIDGAREALERLRAVGARIAVISNMDFRLPALLDDLALEPCIDSVFCPSTCGLAKPDARIFTAALDAFGVSAHQALYVGDREENCVAAARSAGLPARRYDPSGDLDDPSVLVSWAALDA